MTNTNIYSHIPYQDISIDLSSECTDNEIKYIPQHIEDISKSDSGFNIGGYMFNNKFMIGIFHSIRNQSYEVYVMYALIIIIIILMIAMTIDSIYDYDQNMINLMRAERV